MSRFRSRWLALFGGVTLIALSMSSALGAKPDAAENRGQQVSTFVHSLQGDVEETEDTEEQVDEETEDEVEEEVEVQEEDSAPSDHGKCVAAVAQDPEAVGPPNDNHGGAVSEAARVTCWDEGDSEVESDEDGDDESEAEAEDADESNGGGNHGKGHGHGRKG
jgi:TolA-binding protein